MRGQGVSRSLKGALYLFPGEAATRSNAQKEHGAGGRMTEENAKKFSRKPKRPLREAGQRALHVLAGQKRCYKKTWGGRSGRGGMPLSPTCEAQRVAQRRALGAVCWVLLPHEEGRMLASEGHLSRRHATRGRWEWARRGGGNRKGFKWVPQSRFHVRGWTQSRFHPFPNRESCSLDSESQEVELAPHTLPRMQLTPTQVHLPTRRPGRTGHDDARGPQRGSPEVRGTQIEPRLAASVYRKPLLGKILSD